MEVLKAINAVQAALVMQGGITKDRKNQSQGYNFRGIDDMYNTLAPVLARAKLVVLPSYSDRQVTERETKNGGALFYVTLRGDFTFRSTEDDSAVTVSTYGEAMDSGDKATNKAMSAALKYAFMQTFTIPTEADNDADTHTHEVKSAKIRPASGAMESLDTDMQNYCMDVAHNVETLFRKGDVVGAHDEWEIEGAKLEKSSEFAKVAAWDLIASDVRSAIKREHEKRKPQKVAA